MSETQQLTEHQRAAMVARFVEIQEISLVSVNAQLITPKAKMLSSESWKFEQEKQATHYFDEEKRILAIVLDLKTEASGDDQGERLALFRCTGSYALIYSFNATGGPPPEERDAFFGAFANINATYNAWPFFRELVHSTLGRMGLQPVSLPVYRVALPAMSPSTAPASSAAHSPQ